MPQPPIAPLIAALSALAGANSRIAHALADFEEAMEDPAGAVDAVRQAVGACWQPLWAHCLLLEEGAVHPALSHGGTEAVARVATLQRQHQQMLALLVRVVPGTQPDLATSLGTARTLFQTLRIHLSQVEMHLQPMVDRNLAPRELMALRQEIDHRAAMVLQAPPIEDVWQRRAPPRA